MKHVFRYIATIFLVAVFVFNGSLKVVAASDDWITGDWMYRQKISLLNAGQAENLVDFTVLVKKTSTDTAFWGAVNADCSDLRFTDSDGTTLLSFSIQQCDNVEKKLLAWVKVPQVNASSNNDYVYIYFGNDDASSTASSGAWGSEYLGVWHLDEAGATIPDSTANENDGQNTNTEISTGGRIGSAVNFTSAGSIEIGDELTKPDFYTLSVWLKPTSWDNSGILFSYRDDGTLALETRWGIFGFADENMGIFTSNENETAYGWNTFYGGWNSTSFPSDEWTQLTAVFDTGQATRLYRNGEFIESSTLPSVTSNSGTAYPMRFGYYNIGPDVYPYLGEMDEVRILNQPKSDEWIKASYLNETDSFTSFSSVENLLPDQPTVTDITVSGSSATVEFTPPVSEGISPITGYTVIASPGAITTTGSSSPITVPGLTPGVTYTFTVSATTALGSSPVSIASDPVVVPETVTASRPAASAAVLLQYIQQPNQQQSQQNITPKKLFSGATLRLGSRGEDVRALQKFLNSQGFTVARSGAGSAGKETTLFGAQTRAALIRYQAVYAKEILTPARLTRPTGILGPLTIAHIEKGI